MAHKTLPVYQNAQRQLLYSIIHTSVRGSVIDKIRITLLIFSISVIDIIIEKTY